MRVSKVIGTDTVRVVMTTGEARALSRAFRWVGRMLKVMRRGAGQVCDWCGRGRPLARDADLRVAAILSLARGLDDALTLSNGVPERDCGSSVPASMATPEAAICETALKWHVGYRRAEVH